MLLSRCSDVMNSEIRKGRAEKAAGMRRNSLYQVFAARSAAIMAYQMTGVAVAWQVYELTHRPLDLGLVGLVQFIPSLLLVLFVGHVADRYDRRWIVTCAQLVEALALVALLVATMGHWINRELIFLFIFLMGSARAFESTTMQTLIPSLVAREELPRALAINASVSQASIILGPVLGGFIYMLGPTTVYGTGMVLFLVSATLISTIRLQRVVQLREPASLATVFAGFAFIRQRPVLLGAISFDLFAVLLGGATALLPIYARDILMIGPKGLGLLRSAPAVGAFTASLWLARHPLRDRVGKVMFTAVAWFGLATIIFGLSRSVLLSFIALVVLGWADMVSMVIRSSLVQLETPDEMRGRVSAVNSVFIGASNQLGEFESGLTAAWFGVVPAAVIGGAGTLLIVALWRCLFPQLAGRDRLLSSESVVVSAS
jgi:MFS family permease